MTDYLIKEDVFMALTGDITDCTIEEFIARLRNKLSKLPSVTPKEKTGWIPVSESLPEINKDILVCDRDGDIYISHLTQYNNYFSEQGDEIRGVKAWMSLPEPYKAESEVNE